MFKKLFTINYNGKRFLILVTNDHRKTFLEVTNDGKYIYPELGDFLALNQIYNNYDYTIKYENNYERLPRYVSYTERIREKSALLLLLCTTYVFAIKSIADIDRENNQVKLSYVQEYQMTERDTQALYSIYGSKITREDVIDVINNNSNIPSEYKKIAIEVMDTNLKLDPEADLRIYYENMIDNAVIFETESEMNEDGTMNRSAYFSLKDHNVHLMEISDTIKREAIHEYTHAFHELIDQVDKNAVYVHETFGYSLAEAMTEKISNNVEDCGLSYYGVQQMFLNYFMNNVTNFNYHIYNQRGITALIQELKEKYPDVDIDYLVDCLDTYTTSQLYKLCEEYDLFSDEEFCNELFKIAIRNIDKDDIYGSFDEFKKLLGPSIQKYLDLYNKELVTRGFIQKDTLDLINEINSVCLIDEKFYFAISDTEYLDYNGEKIRIDESKKAIFLSIKDDVREKLICNCVVSGQNVYSLNNIKLLFRNNRFYSELGIPLYTNEEKTAIMDSLLKLGTSNLNPKDLYSGLYPIYCFINYDLCYDYNLASGVYNEYIKRYDNEVVNHGFISNEQIELIRNTLAIAKCNENIYLLNNNDFINYSASLLSIKDTEFGYRYRCFMLDNDFELSVHDENNSKVNSDIFELILLGDGTRNKLIQYVVDNDIKNVVSNNFLNDLDKQFGLFESKKINTYSDGKTAFEEVNDNMYLEIGYNENGNVGLQLFDGDELIYGSCKRLRAPIVRIPFKTYIQLINCEEYNYLDEIISVEALSSISERFLKYYIPSLDMDYQKVQKEHDGTLYTDYETIYKFSEPIKIIVDGNEYSSRSIYMFENIERDLILHLPDGNNIIMGNLDNASYWFASDFNFYFDFFDSYLKYLNIFPNDNGKYNFTKDEIIQIVSSYINAENVDNYHNKESKTY